MKPFSPSLLLLTTIITAALQTPRDHTMTPHSNHAFSAILTLNENWYNTSNGLWNNTWWQTANMLTTVSKYGIHTPSFAPVAKSIIENTYAKSPNLLGAKKWLNNFYDDQGWWALAWIAAYDLTGEVKYLDTAKYIFEDMTGGWTTGCGGGIWWDKEKTSIAAIANELFLSVAAHLVNRVGEEEKGGYVEWAVGEWTWFSEIGVINEQNLVNDGIDKETCVNDGKTVWTYNQGVILGGLAELAKATGETKYTDRAREIARAALGKLTKGGVLTESREVLDETAAMFKGAFVRGLVVLYEEVGDEVYAEFLEKNADSAWKNRGNDGIIGPSWLGEEQGESGVSSHASGVDVSVAAVQAGR